MSAAQDTEKGYHSVVSSTDSAKTAGTVPSLAKMPPKLLTRSESEIERERQFAPEMSPLESLNLEDSESVQWRKYRLKRHFQSEHHRISDAQAFAGRNWILVFVVGIAVGCVGAVVLVLSHALLEWKFNVTHDLIDAGNWGAAFFAYLGFSMFFVGIATFLGYIEPKSTGSGISEVKVYLNGVNLKGFLNPRAVLVKAVGVCFSVASGLPIGKKAPMVHVGAAIAATISQGRKKTFGFDTSWSVHTDFQNDKMRADSLVYGIAAGIAAVFRAPIGGVLFALEESASHWSATVTIKAFICAMVAMMTVNILFADSGFGTTEVEHLFVFGQFSDIKPGETNYRTWELFIFILMGFTGGVIGAGFNAIMKKIHLKHDSPSFKKLQYVRVLLFTIVMAIITFLLPLMFHQCHNLPSDADKALWTSEEKDLVKELVQFQCKDGEYNQLASLFLTPAETAIKQLFHFREYEGSNYATFGFLSLFMFLIPYFFLSSATAGLSVPRGVFIPTLLAGAAYGRIWGHVLNSISPGNVADAGTYALMGAAAINGGVTRITIAMTIIMLETSGNITYLLPLMVTFIAARYSGNAINSGLYDLLIYINELPFIVTSLRNLGLLNFSPVSELMAAPVKVFHVHERVRDIYKVLKETKHNGFPVVNREGKLQGIILRHTLCTLLELSVFSKEVPDSPVKPAAAESDVGLKRRPPEISVSPSVSSPRTGGFVRATKQDLHRDDEDVILDTPSRVVYYDTLQSKYPKFTRIDDITLDPAVMDLWIDLSEYTDTGPYVVHTSTSMERSHRLFRTMGLRHLIVVNNSHEPVGMITRKDIMYSKLHKHFLENKQALETATAESMITTPRGGSNPSSPTRTTENVISSRKSPFGSGSLASSSNEDEGLEPLNAGEPSSTTHIELKPKGSKKKRSDQDYVNADNV